MLKFFPFCCFQKIYDGIPPFNETRSDGLLRNLTGAPPRRIFKRGQAGNTTGEQTQGTCPGKSLGKIPHTGDKASLDRCG